MAGYSRLGLVFAIICTIFLVEAPQRAAAQEAAPTREQLQAQVNAMARQLRSPDADQREQALHGLRAMAKDNPQPFTDRLSDWIGPVLELKHYDDVMSFTEVAINQRAYDTPMVVQAQRARVLALLEQGKNDQALAEAKGFYNVADLAQTPEAIDIVARAFTSAGSPMKAMQFRSEQVATAEAGNPVTVENVWADVPINTQRYEATIIAMEARKNGSGLYSASNLLARGNMLLLSDRPLEARACFELGVAAAGTNGRQIRESLAGIARAIRAGSGNVAAANDFITATRADTAAAAARIGGSIDVAALRTAAQQINLAQVQLMTQPPLEMQRSRAEKPTDPPAVLTSNFEMALPVSVETVSPSHVRVMMRNAGYQEWFMFKLNGVAGRTVRIHIRAGSEDAIKYWWSMNPVYADGALDLADPATFAVGEATGEPVKASNGPMLPPRSAAKWQYIPDVWIDSPGSISFVQNYDTDTAWVAMRVPHTPDYNAAWMKRIDASPLATVDEVGQSRGGKPLLIVKIADENTKPADHKPGILIYGGEHGTNTDTMWAIHGAIDYLIGDSAQAKQLRSRYVFICLPMFDPDASAGGRVAGVMYSFRPGVTTPEPMAYAKWFQKWVDDGNRLDAIVNLYNYQSAEGTQMDGVMMEGGGERGAATDALHAMIIAQARKSGFTVSDRVQNRGVTPERLGGWLTQRFGPICLAYEINSQARDRHLSLAEIQGYGPAYCDAVGAFLASAEGVKLMAIVDQQLKTRKASWDAHPEAKNIENAIDAESIGAGEPPRPVRPVLPRPDAPQPIPLPPQ